MDQVIASERDGMSCLALYTFGSPRLERDGVPVPIRRRRVTALLVYLAVTGRTHRRDALATLFYPEHDQGQARARLRRTLSTLKTALGEGWLHVDLETVRLNREDAASSAGQGLWLDAAAFQELLDECRAHGHPPEQVCPACLPLLSETVALYRDDFLAGFTLRDSPGFDDWQSFQTAREPGAVRASRPVRPALGRAGPAERACAALPHVALCPLGPARGCPAAVCGM